MSDTSQLSAPDLSNYERDRVPASTKRSTLRRAVYRALLDYYGTEVVESKNKCLRVRKRPGYLDADVVPCIQHRKYVEYPSWGEPRYVEGVSIKPLEGGIITNFPKEHIKNGKRKSRETSEHYKPTVRQLKNLKRKCVEDGVIGKGLMPGYVLECMAYNAPTSLFVSRDAERMIKVLLWLKAKSPEDLASNFWSGDGVHHLFQDDPGQHNQYTAHRVLEAMWDHL